MMVSDYLTAEFKYATMLERKRIEGKNLFNEYNTKIYIWKIKQIPFLQRKIKLATE